MSERQGRKETDMAKKIPAYIINKLEALKKANARVAALTNEIADWADKYTDYGTMNIIVDGKLDVPFEYDMENAIEVIMKEINK